MLLDGDHPDGEPPESAQPPTPVTVVIVAFGAEPWLERSVEAVLGSVGVAANVVLVDNGCTDGAVARLAGRDGVTVVDAGRNVGFAEGCNVGVAATSPADAPVVALVNPDAVVEPGALARLCDRLSEPGVGIATCSLRLADRPDLLNSAGNEVHFLGLSWSGSFERPAVERDRPLDVLAASGAGMAIRRDIWEELGGFAPELFAYQEDAELSLRCWLAGYRVVYEPTAVITHRYEFSRNPTKFFLLDRNRLWVLLTVYDRRTLALLAPLLLLQEAAMFAVAAAQGWFGQRLRSVAWIVAHRSDLVRRRRHVQAGRRRGDVVVAPMLAEVVQPGNHPLPGWAVTAQWPLVGYWRLVRRSLR